jgi:hypothetical protein
VIVRYEGELIVVADGRRAWLRPAAVGVVLVVIGWFLLRPDAPAWIVILGVLLAAFGLVVFFLPMERIEIDRRQRELRTVKRWLWGRGRSRATAFAEIESVDVEALSGEDGSETYYPRIVLKSGRGRRLTSTGTSDRRDAEGAASLARQAILGEG